MSLTSCKHSLQSLSVGLFNEIDHSPMQCTLLQSPPVYKEVFVQVQSPFSQRAPFLHLRTAQTSLENSHFWPLNVPTHLHSSIILPSGATFSSQIPWFSQITKTQRRWWVTINWFHILLKAFFQMYIYMYIYTLSNPTSIHTIWRYRLLHFPTTFSKTNRWHTRQLLSYC